MKRSSFRQDGKNDSKVARLYFKIEGEKLVKVPQGFDKEDPMGDYLKYKELMIHHSVSDKEIISENFASYCTKIFKMMIPFNSFVNKPVMAL